MPKAMKRPFKPHEGKIEDDKHIRLTSHMLGHIKFRKLKPSAKTLYIYMRDWAGAFATKVKYSAKMAEYVMSPPTYYKARDELIKAGFIYWINKPIASSQKNDASEFEFVDTWYTGIVKGEPE